MIYRNLEFHNVMELEKMEGIPGLRLQRLPKQVRNSLGYKDNENGRIVSQTSTGCEIRFVTDARKVRLYLSSLDEDGEVLVFKGNFFNSRYSLKAGVLTTLKLEEPEKFSEVKPEVLKGYAFSSNVWRIFMSRGFSLMFHDIDTFGHEVRVPDVDEVPKLKWLAYGSSITHGASALVHSNSYIQQAARRLGVDVMCNGLSGACQCEKEIADYIATRGDWDFVTLELGVNMRIRFNTEEFERQVRYLVKTVVDSNPGKPVILITIYPNSSEYLANEESSTHIRNMKFIQILKDIHKEMNNKDLYLIEGKDILTDFSGLTCDLLHPSDFGHILMGENLDNKLKNILPLYF